MWYLIFALILIGLALVVIEVIFIPGTTLIGILGVLFLAAAIYTTYENYGSQTGLYFLIGTAAVTAVTLFFSFRSRAWMRFANKSAINSKVNEGTVDALSVGDEGTTRSTLRPVGRVLFKNGEFEAKTLGDYVDVGTKVKIVHIDGHQIIVKPIN